MTGPRLYRLLLRLYPRRFRDRFGGAMAETFAEEWAAARNRGMGSSAFLILRTVARTPLLAMEERMRAWAGGWSAGAWATDLHQAVRSISRAPGFSLVVALTVGLGVGATVSIYSIADWLLLRELPVHEPDRLVRVTEERSSYTSVGKEGPRIPVERYERLRDELTGSVFSGLAGHDSRSLAVRADGPAFSAMGEITTGNYFQVLGLAPAVGRFYTTGDEPSVVLGHRLWRGRFAGDPSAIGRTVHLGGRPFTVIGVAPADFASTIGFLHIEFFVPIGAHDRTVWPGAPVALFGRLAPKLDIAIAEERAEAIVARIPQDDDPEAELLGADLEPLTPTPPSMAGPLRFFLWMLFATAVLVLLIAGANVAGILVARAARRERETAVRLALGAGRGQLARQWMLEAVGLFALGGLVGTTIAAAVGKGLSWLSFPTAEPIVVDAVPDLGALGFAMAVAVLAGLLFGWMPALHAARAKVATGLRNGDRAVSRGGSRARDVFVTAQLAMSVVLLVAATLFVRTAHRNMTADLGFDPEGVVVAQLDLSPHGYGEEEGRLFYDRLVEQAGALPGVESVALAGLAMMTGESSTFGGWRLHPDSPGVSAAANRVDGRYFETMGIEVIAGRGIEPTDVEGAPEVIVVNESFARRFWPDESPIGKTILQSEVSHEVVGLTRDGSYAEFGTTTPPFIFLSSHQRYGAWQTLHLRTRPGAEPAELIARVRALVAAMDPDVAVVQAMPLTSAMAALLFPQRFAAALIGVFGLLGLFLAATGVYGVLAHHVVQRTREFGVRIALGAEPGGLLGMVLGRGALLTGIGAVVGLALAAAVTRLMASLLLGISPWDPVAFVGVPLVLAVVALVASGLPARRILRLDPIEALRQE